MNSATFFRTRSIHPSVLLVALIALAPPGSPLAGETCEFTLGGNGHGAATTSNDREAFACGSDASASGLDSLAVGTFSSATGEDSTAIGNASQASGLRSAAIGLTSRAIGAQSSAFGTGAQATADDSVALGTDSTADRANTVSVGSLGRERQISNVADATEATDAINLRQLNTAVEQAALTANAAVLDEASTHTDQQVAQVRAELAGGDAQTLQQANAHADAGDAATLQTANAYTDQRINELAGFDFTGFDQRLDGFDRRLRVQDERISRLGAMSAAMSQMSANTSDLSGANRVGVGVGGYDGKAALSIGYQRAFRGNRASLSVGAAFTGSETLFGGGAGISW